MDICIATTTFYPDANSVRAQLAVKAAKEAAKHNIPFVVVDGESSGKFLREISVGGMHNIFHGKNRDDGTFGLSRRRAIGEASEVSAAGKGAVFWMESEKWPIVPYIRDIVQTMEIVGADIIVPARKSLESYPPIQRLAERLGNMYFGKATDHNLDVWIGPRLIGPRALPYFLDYKGEYGDKWDSIFIPIVRAIADGLIVIGKEVDYVHPPEQTAEEEKDPEMDLKRLGQLQNLVPAFYAEAKKLGLLK